MVNVGDKFVIEVKEVRGENPKLYTIRGFDNLMFDDYGLKQLEKLDSSVTKRESYSKGYADGYKAGKKNPENNRSRETAKDLYDRGYARGRIEGKRSYDEGFEAAWEVARRITASESKGGFSHEQLMYIFDSDSPNDIFSDNTGAKVQKKIEALKKEDKEAIRIGDEVTNGLSDRWVVTSIVLQIAYGINRFGQARSGNIGDLKRTGKRNPQLIEALHVMRTESE